MQGCVLLAQRRPEQHLAGMWEFPGGKKQPHETALQALTRELDEELGIKIEPSSCQPLLRVPWIDGGQPLCLDSWRVGRWQGKVRPMENQALQWSHLQEVNPASLIPADRSILQALRLPPCYPITPDQWPTNAAETVFQKIRKTIEQDATLLQLRLPNWPVTAVRDLAARLLPTLHKKQSQLLLNADIAGARQLGVGVHLQAKQLMTLNARPLAWNLPVAASCHNAKQLEQAVHLRADFAPLSPLMATRSPPQATPLGWANFRLLAETASIPIYALGGLGPNQLKIAQQAGAQGVAGISAFW